jgi:hypothetical protein
MKDFISPLDRAMLEAHRLASFEALWSARLERVDSPNLERGGWSEVCRLDVNGQGYYLKRQSNHLARGFGHPWGEPTFAREFRTIRRLHTLGVPTLDVAFFAHHRLRDEITGKMKDCAILLTRALDGWWAMEHWFADWANLPAAVRERLLVACGKLARRLHGAGLIHGCFYPKHVFLRMGEGREGSGDEVEEFEAALIDLEKVRPAWLGRRDHARDLDQFFRHAPALGGSEADIMIASYLACAPDRAEVGEWRQSLSKRRLHKERERR